MKFVSEETRLKLRLSQLGNKNSFYGKSHSEENKKNWSKSKQGSNNPFYGKKHTPETIEKLRQNRLKNPTYNKHPKDCHCPFCYGLSREKNPNWRGGISFEPYHLGWTKTFKEQIRFRDEYKCQVCGKPEVENIRKLDVHHIDYIKQNISPLNLISLCKTCHSKTKFNRNYWIEFFKPFTLNLAWNG